MVEKNKLTDIKKQEEHRRVELAMLGLLIEKYQREECEKAQKYLLGQKVEKTTHRLQSL